MLVPGILVTVTLAILANGVRITNSVSELGGFFQSVQLPDPNRGRILLSLPYVNDSYLALELDYLRHPGSSGICAKTDLAINGRNVDVADNSTFLSVEAGRHNSDQSARDAGRSQGTTLPATVLDVEEMQNVTIRAGLVCATDMMTVLSPHGHRFAEKIDFEVITDVISSNPDHGRQPEVALRFSLIYDTSTLGYTFWADHDLLELLDSQHIGTAINEESFNTWGADHDLKHAIEKLKTLQTGALKLERLITHQQRLVDLLSHTKEFTRGGVINAVQGLYDQMRQDLQSNQIQSLSPNHPLQRALDSQSSQVVSYFYESQLNTYDHLWPAPIRDPRARLISTRYDALAALIALPAIIAVICLAYLRSARKHRSTRQIFRQNLCCAKDIFTFFCDWIHNRMTLRARAPHNLIRRDRRADIAPTWADWWSAQTLRRHNDRRMYKDFMAQAAAREEAMPEELLNIPAEADGKKTMSQVHLKTDKEVMEGRECPVMNPVTVPHICFDKLAKKLDRTASSTGGGSDDLNVAHNQPSLWAEAPETHSAATDDSPIAHTSSRLACEVRASSPRASSRTNALQSNDETLSSQGSRSLSSLNLSSRNSTQLSIQQAERQPASRRSSLPDGDESSSALPSYFDSPLVKPPSYHRRSISHIAHRSTTSLGGASCADHWSGRTSMIALTPSLSIETLDGRAATDANHEVVRDS